ncbi:Uncharacterised protein [Mycobacterium tuberculosis]|nr:Uncharacterised protein [Mycobacterium tuberculosis]
MDFNLFQGLIKVGFTLQPIIAPGIHSHKVKIGMLMPFILTTMEKPLN